MPNTPNELYQSVFLNKTSLKEIKNNPKRKNQFFSQHKIRTIISHKKTSLLGKLWKPKKEKLCISNVWEE